MFKQIKDYPNYEVSTNGEVRNTKTNKFLTPYITERGYFAITLYKDSVKKKVKVHRLVAITFIENPLNLETVNHIDGCKTNNNINNLEWLSNNDNMQHAIKNNLVNQIGENNARTKLTNIIVKEIKKMINSKYSVKEISNFFNISKNIVWQIKIGRNWSHIDN